MSETSKFGSGGHIKLLAKTLIKQIEKVAGKKYPTSCTVYMYVQRMN